MNLKILLYCIAIPLSIYSLECINLDKFIKKRTVFQIKLLYLLISLCLSYLIVNFFYDFYINFKIF